MTDAVLSQSGVSSALPVHAAALQDPGPVSPSERIRLLDVLRGFALFGILQVNWGSNYLSDGFLLDSIVGFFFDSSFKPLFSFLFGLGFAIQLLRAEEKNRPIVLRYIWRMLLLFVIGAAHYVLIWDGDIAYRYALMGLLLLLFFKWRPAMLLAAAAATFLFFVAPSENFNSDGRYWLRPNPELAEVGRLELRSRQVIEGQADFRWGHAFAEGTFGDRVAASAGNLRLRLGRAYHGDFLKDKANIFLMFLLGLYAGRRRILHHPQTHRRLLIGVLAIGFLLGVVGGAHKYFPQWLTSIGVDLPDAFNWGSLGESLGDFGMTFGYMAAITLLFTYHALVRRLLAPFADVGRMSLTNYIMQGVILTALTGAGTLFPHGVLRHPLDSVWRIVLLVAVFAVQIAYSRWWFQRFEFGPVEWVWRSLTWFRMQHIRAPAVQTAAA